MSPSSDGRLSQIFLDLRPQTLGNIQGPPNARMDTGGGTSLPNLQGKLGTILRLANEELQ